jgi:hypothetical protein
MIRIDDLDRALGSYLDAEALAPAPVGLLEAILEGTSRLRPEPAWRVGLGRPRIARPTRWSNRLVAAAALLVVATLTAVAVGVGALVTPRPAPVPSDPPTPSASTPPVGPLPAALDGMWVANQPPWMSFGMPSGPKRMSLNLGSSSTFLSDHWKIGWMSADASATTATVRLVSRIEDSDSALGRNLPTAGIALPGDGSGAGQLLRACRDGDVGVYRWLVFPEGGTLSLTKVSDDCPARPAIVENTVWERAERTRLDGRIRIDAVSPVFTATLPTGEYEVTTSIGAYQAIGPEAAFSVFQDPRVLRDGCDARAGVIDLGPGTENLLGALEQRPELTVHVESGRRVGGALATVATVQARANDGCPQDVLRGWWHATGEGSGRISTIYAGWAARLVFVDVSDHTLMFDIEPSSPEVQPGQGILDSIRFEP